MWMYHLRTHLEGESVIDVSPEDTSEGKSDVDVLPKDTSGGEK